MNKKFKGITLNGKALSEDLVDDLDSEKTTEIEEVRREAVYIPLGGGNKTYKGEPKKGPCVSKRVRHLTDEEIRKGYGLMERPFKTTLENIIWIILNSKEPVSPIDIAERLTWAKSMSSLSALISVTYKALSTSYTKVGEGSIITREKFGKSFTYSSTPHPGHKQNRLFVSNLAGRVNDYQRRMYRKNHKPKLPPITSTTPASLAEELRNKITPPLATSKFVNKAIEQILEKTLGMKIEVSGHINIIIKMG